MELRDCVKFFMFVAECFGVTCVNLLVNMEISMELVVQH